MSNRSDKRAQLKKAIELADRAVAAAAKNHEQRCCQRDEIKKNLDQARTNAERAQEAFDDDPKHREEYLKARDGIAPLKVDLERAQRLADKAKSLVSAAESDQKAAVTELDRYLISPEWIDQLTQPILQKLIEARRLQMQAWSEHRRMLSGVHEVVSGNPDVSPAFAGHGVSQLDDYLCPSLMTISSRANEALSAERNSAPTPPELRRDHDAFIGNDDPWLLAYRFATRSLPSQSP